MSTYKATGDGKDAKRVASQSNTEGSEDERYETGNSPMLLFKRSENQREAFAYAFLLRTEFLGNDGEDVIHLDYGFCMVALAGRNLEELYRKICVHDVKYIPAVGSGTVGKHGQGVREIHVVESKETQEKGA